VTRNEVTFQSHTDQHKHTLTYRSSLAYAELYMALAYVFWRFEMEVYETVEERDVETTSDCFIGMTDLSSVGIRVWVAEVED
jgi:hypothetical protein